MRRLLILLALIATPATAQSIHDRIYQPPTAPLSTDGLPAGATIDTVTTADGLTLHGIEVPGDADRPLLLLFHGNASSAASMAQWFAPLIAQGYGVVAADYRGYSGNPGRPDAKGLAADAEAFHARAAALAGSRRVIVVGHSLGAGAAFGLATRHRLDALVTIGAFTRLRDMAPRIARVLVPDDYNNLAAVPGLDEPWFLIHGTADDVVPAQFGNALHNAAVKAQKAGGSYVLTGAGHQPDGTLIAAVLAAIIARVTDAPAPALPAAVAFYPFGG